MSEPAKPVPGGGGQDEIVLSFGATVPAGNCTHFNWETPLASHGRLEGLGEYGAAFVKKRSNALRLSG